MVPYEYPLKLQSLELTYGMNILYNGAIEKARASSSTRPCLSKHILNRNDKSEHITHLDNVVRIIITWSE